MGTNMNNYCICYNLSDSVVELQVNNINYRIMPQGYKDMLRPELKDNCSMREEDTRHPIVQKLLMEHKIKISYFKENKPIEDSEVLLKNLEDTINFSRNKFMEFQNGINSLVTNKLKEVSANVSKTTTSLVNDIDTLKSKIADLYEMASKINSVLDSLETKVSKKDKKDGKENSKSNDSSPSQLFRR